MKTLLSAVAAAALIAGGALAQNASGQTGGMSGIELDRNQDRQVTRDEFDTGMERHFGQSDADESGGLSEDEYSRSGMGDDQSFSAYDTNQDSELSQDEYSEGVFSEFDRNQDDMLDQDETNAYDDWRGSGGQPQSN